MRKGIKGLFCLLITFVVMIGATFFLLWGLAKLLWNTSLTVAAARGIMVGLRVVVGIIGGLVIGIMCPKNRICWGIAVGAIYFAAMLVMRMMEWNWQIRDVEEVLILFVLCVCSPVIGSLLHFPIKKGFS